MRARALGLGFVVLLAVGVAACSDDGGGSSDGAGGDGTRASAAPSTAAAAGTRAPDELRIEEFDVPAGSHPHDVAVGDDGIVWYTAQSTGRLGRLDPSTGDVEEIPLGDGSRPHGVIIGPGGAPWITDGGLNAIVRVDPESRAVRVYPLPAAEPDANLNTAAFDSEGVLWFTGQGGIYGRLASPDGEVEVFDPPRGPGPYGITVTPDGDVYYASLAGSYLGRIDRATAEATVLEPPTADQGTRRVWSDSQGRVWSSQWNVGQVAVYEPATNNWKEWKLPGDAPQAYAVFVDDDDIVWLSDFGANSLVRFDPHTEKFTVLPLPSDPGDVRQIDGRPGEVWGAESAADQLVVVRT